MLFCPCWRCHDQAYHCLKNTAKLPTWPMLLSSTACRLRLVLLDYLRCKRSGILLSTDRILLRFWTSCIQLPSMRSCRLLATRRSSHGPSRRSGMPSHHYKELFRNQGRAMLRRCIPGYFSRTILLLLLVHSNLGERSGTRRAVCPAILRAGSVGHILDQRIQHLLLLYK